MEADSQMDNIELTDAERRALHAQCLTALDELTASLTQVLRSVNRVHKVVERLGVAVNGSGQHADDIESHPKE